MSPSQSRRGIPWTYYLIVSTTLVGVMIVTALVCATIGTNPYIGATIAGLAYGLHETWVVTKRGGRR